MREQGLISTVCPVFPLISVSVFWVKGLCLFICLCGGAVPAVGVGPQVMGLCTGVPATGETGVSACCLGVYVSVCNR